MITEHQNSKTELTLDQLLAIAKARKNIKGKNDSSLNTLKRKTRSQEYEDMLTDKELKAELKAKKKAERLAKIEENKNRPSKLERTFMNLPELNKDAKDIVELAKVLHENDMNCIIKHLQYYIKQATHKKVADIRTTVRNPVIPGDVVKIVGGDPSYVGKIGIVDRVQRVRCFVEIDQRKPVYIYLSDVEVIQNDDVSIPEIDRDSLTPMVCSSSSDEEEVVTSVSSPTDEDDSIEDSEDDFEDENDASDEDDEVDEPEDINE